MSVEINKLKGEYEYPIIAGINGESHRILIIDVNHNAIEFSRIDATFKPFGKIKDLFKNEMGIYDIWPIGSKLTFTQEYKK